MDISQLIIIIAVIVAALIFLAIGIALIFFGGKIFRSGSKKNIFIGSQNMPEEAKKIFDSFPDTQKIFGNIFDTVPHNQPNPDTQYKQGSDPNNEQTPNSEPYENIKNTSNKQPEGEGQGLSKWEYMTIQLMPANKQWDANYFSQQVNCYGEQGWELVSVFSTEGVGAATLMTLVGGVTNGVFAMFKRPKS